MPKSNHELGQAVRTAQKKYYQKNREAILNYQKEYKLKNPEEFNQKKLTIKARYEIARMEQIKRSAQEKDPLNPVNIEIIFDLLKKEENTLTQEEYEDSVYEDTEYDPWEIPSEFEQD